MGGLTGLDGTVHALASFDPDGSGPAAPRLIAGGSFSAAGNVWAANIAALDVTTGLWTPLGTGTNGPVRALAVLASGDLVAGGEFTIAGGLVTSYIARWNGNAWAPMGTGMDWDVRALAAQPNGDLYVGGRFSVAGGVLASRIARWSPSGWSALTTGISSLQPFPEVNALALQTNGHLVVGGTFSLAGGVAGNNIARWDGTTWYTMGPGMNGAVHALAVMPNGDVVAGGEFTLIGGLTALRVARFSGLTWATMGSFAGPVRSTFVRGNGTLVAANDLGSGTGGQVKQWTGSTWTTVGDMNEAVHVLADSPGGALVAGGAFTFAGGAAALRTAIWSGLAWSAVSNGIQGSVRAMLRLANGDIVAGGGDASVGSAAIGHVSRWSGNAWSRLGGSFDGLVHSLVAMPNGDLLAGGEFAHVGAVLTNAIARWGGSTWQPMVSSPVSVRAMRVSPTGNMAAGGDAGVYRWTGSAWVLLPGSPVGVRALLWLPSGDLIAGGIFASPLAYVARWNGTSWSQYAPGIGQPVYSLALTPIGELLAGTFQATGSVRRWDGSGWATLGGAISGTAWSLLPLPGNVVVVGGDFAAFGPVPMNRVARWSGGSWGPLGQGTQGPVYSLLDIPNGDLLVGGEFTTAGGGVAPKVANHHLCQPRYDTFGPGCPGSLGVPRNTATALPQIGATLVVECTHLPMSMAFLSIGWSNTAWSVGPLPFDLTALGLPGCALRVSNDLLVYISGSAQTATWSLPIPSASALLGLSLHTQALSVDPGFNSFGAAMSDAATATIGL